MIRTAPTVRPGLYKQRVVRTRKFSGEGLRLTIPSLADRYLGSGDGAPQFSAGEQEPSETGGVVIAYSWRRPSDCWLGDRTVCPHRAIARRAWEGELRARAIGSRRAQHERGRKQSPSSRVGECESLFAGLDHARQRRGSRSLHAPAARERHAMAVHLAADRTKIGQSNCGRLDEALRFVPPGTDFRTQLL